MKKLGILGGVITLAVVAMAVINYIKISRDRDILSERETVATGLINDSSFRHIYKVDTSTQFSLDTFEVGALYSLDAFSDTDQKMMLSKENTLKESAQETKQDFKTFCVKIAFSGVFCIAALFVILSQKYDSDTKSWAIGILNLIAGVWIGTLV
jgi:hypothetical protein